MPEEGHSAVSGCRYVRQRETVMIAERLGCQACILFCGLQAASVQHSAEVAQSWPGVILAEVVASALQLLHLPIGFQVGFWPRLLQRRAYRGSLSVRKYLEERSPVQVLCPASFGALPCQEKGSSACIQGDPVRERMTAVQISDS